MDTLDLLNPFTKQPFRLKRDASDDSKGLENTCFMEAVSLILGQKRCWRPEGIDALVTTAFASWNDSFRDDDEARTKTLTPYLRRVASLHGKIGIGERASIVEELARSPIGQCFALQAGDGTAYIRNGTFYGLTWLSSWRDPASSALLILEVAEMAVAGALPGGRIPPAREVRTCNDSFSSQHSWFVAAPSDNHWATMMDATFAHPKASAFGAMWSSTPPSQKLVPTAGPVCVPRKPRCTPATPAATAIAPMPSAARTSVTASPSPSAPSVTSGTTRKRFSDRLTWRPLLTKRTLTMRT